MSKLFNFVDKANAYPSSSVGEIFKKSLLSNDQTYIKNKEAITYDMDTLNPVQAPNFAGKQTVQFQLDNLPHNFIGGYTLHIHWASDGTNTPTAKKLLALSLLSSFEVKIGPEFLATPDAWAIPKLIRDSLTDENKMPLILDLMGGDAFTFNATGDSFDYYIPLTFIPGFSIPPLTSDIEFFPICQIKQGGTKEQRQFQISIKTNPIADCFSAGTAIVPDVFELMYNYYEIDANISSIPTYKSLFYTPVTAAIDFTSKGVAEKVKVLLDSIKASGTVCQKILFSVITNTDYAAGKYYDSVSIPFCEFKTSGNNNIMSNWSNDNEYIYKNFMRTSKANVLTIGSTSKNEYSMYNASIHSTYSDLSKFVTNGFNASNIADFSLNLYTGVATTDYKILMVGIYKAEIDLGMKGGVIKW